MNGLVVSTDSVLEVLRGLCGGFLLGFGLCSDGNQAFMYALSGESLNEDVVRLEMQGQEFGQRCWLGGFELFLRELGVGPERLIRLT